MDAKAAFKQRVHEWKRTLDVEIAWLGIRPMRRKWASCSTNGHLNFNNELLSLPPRVQDYVIVHELLHLRVPNHGKLWKSLMRGYLGEWEAVREELNARLPALHAPG
ncbi:MAG: M48 family metallopeptidase [Flavobacteriales bacterium]|jgi:predicted metal-dependent hydrolase|nr:M48 family metallopeptidase [Flavobacteriales bacterium]